MLTQPVRRFVSALPVMATTLPVLLVGCRPGGGAAVVATEEAVLTHAPAVPPPISRTQPTRMIVNLETQELVRRLADGVSYTFWTFGGEVPGQFIRVREGAVVEFHLHNRSRLMRPSVPHHTAPGTELKSQAAEGCCRSAGVVPVLPYVSPLPQFVVMCFFHHSFARSVVHGVSNGTASNRSRGENYSASAMLSMRLIKRSALPSNHRSPRTAK